MDGKTPLPKWKCFKVVEAGKIKSISLHTVGGGATLELELPAGSTHYVEVDQHFLAKHEPKSGGYYVRYDNGYESWSPGDVFDGGYKLVVEDEESLAAAPPRPFQELADMREKEIARAYQYHPPFPDQVPRYTHLRDVCGAVARDMVSMCTPSSELDMALHYLMVANMCANAAIARHQVAPL